MELRKDKDGHQKHQGNPECLCASQKTPHGAGKMKEIHHARFNHSEFPFLTGYCWNYDFRHSILERFYIFLYFQSKKVLLMDDRQMNDTTTGETLQELLKVTDPKEVQQKNGPAPMKVK